MHKCKCKCTVVVVEQNIPVLFKIEFYYNPVLNVFIFFNDNDYKNRIDKYNSEDKSKKIFLYWENQYKPVLPVLW